MVDSTFGAELRRLRTSAGYSLAHVAGVTHYSRGHLSKIESGKARPNEKLASACDVALDTGGVLAALVPPATGTNRRCRAPRELPYDTVHFLGREAELSEIMSLLRPATTESAEPGGPGGPGGSGTPGSPAICAIDGMAGAGKTALAIHVGHRLASRFPDGSLFLDLHGHTAGVPEVSAADALDRLLRRLGVPGEQVPPHIDDRAALFRDRLAVTRMLIILDNARSTEQVRPLLPAAAGCAVLITSRVRLSALDDAGHLTVGTLPAGPAGALFRSIVAGRPDRSGRPDRAGRPDDAGLVERIVESCGRLPLAVRVAAARCADGGSTTLAELADLLADEQSRLDELDDGERSISAAFTVSYESLPDDLRHTFAALGSHPGTDWDVFAAAALAGADVGSTRRRLDRLLDSHLIMQYSGGRYRFHDLLAAYARRIARSAVPGAQRRLAVGRLLDLCLRTADRADRLITPHRFRVPLDLRAEPPDLPTLAGYSDALAWFGTELGNLVALCRAAAENGYTAGCWQLAYTMRGAFFLTKRWEEWIDTHTVALDAARRCGDRRAEAMTLNNLGLALVERGDLATAEAHYRDSLALFEELGDEHGQSNARANRAAVLYYQGDHVAALRENNLALTCYRRHRSRRNAAITLRSIGLVEIELGRLTAALDHLTQALAEFVALGLDLDTAMAHNCLGEGYRRLGRSEQARGCHQRALEHSQRCGSGYEQARAHDGLGHVAADLAEGRRARHHWERALAGYAALGTARSADVRAALATCGPDDTDRAQSSESASSSIQSSRRETSMVSA
ncbi:MAG TPA: tetratricopeptide repeat protein [Mycobacteriales bacterium]|nr:tetratricopeptide repeat protein [Mycobacteriales bacterium]